MPDICITRDKRCFKENSDCVDFPKFGNLRMWINGDLSRKFSDVVGPKRLSSTEQAWHLENADMEIDLNDEWFPELQEGELLYLNTSQQTMTIPERLVYKTENLYLEDIISETYNGNLHWRKHKKATYYAEDNNGEKPYLLTLKDIGTPYETAAIFYAGHLIVRQTSNKEMQALIHTIM